MSARARRWLVAGPLIGIAVLAPACGSGTEAVATIDWRETAPASGTVSDGSVLVDAPADGGVFPLARIDGPAVGGEGYAIVGEVRYEDVQGSGFLEMWSVFDGDERYFSRTLDREGPLAALSGSSAWREFELPFFLQGSEPPRRLEVNLVLPGAGRVWIGSIELVPLGSGTGGWWSDRTAGLMGAVGGTLIGVLGAAIGALVSRGRARAFTMAAIGSAFAVGVALVLVGLVAIGMGQPPAVTFTLLLGGGIVAAVFGVGLRSARRAYADAELRRMRALDRA
ncbi:MAG TPA: hypothetical protein VF029_00985 [Actinomycetota bacterium]